MRPTPEEIQKARADFDENELAAIDASCGPEVVTSIRTLLAATKPPTDKEISDAVDDLATSKRLGMRDRLLASVGMRFLAARLLGPVEL